MSLQARREPLPADYQYPTATCGCPSCASKLTPEPRTGCPKCKGPSLRGDLCFNCTSGPLEPSVETPWGV